MPMNRSRVLTMQAMINEKVENKAAPMMTTAMTPSSASGCHRSRTPSASASNKMINAYEDARTPADSALPNTSAARGVGLTRYLLMMPRSRSQMTEMP